jgi:hypothetical protein
LVMQMQSTTWQEWILDLLTLKNRFYSLQYVTYLCYKFTYIKFIIKNLKFWHYLHGLNKRSTGNILYIIM